MTWIWQHHPEAGRAGALVLSRRVVQFEIQKEGIKEEAVAGTFVYFLPAVMTDPFVQRMMARSHARRAAVAQTLGNKENVSMSDSTRSRLKHLSALHSGNSSEALSPLQPSVDNIEPPRTASLPKKSDFSPDRKLRKEPGDMEMHQPVKIGENQGPTSPHKPRLTSLAKRCQEINNWDDDYSYHSSSHGSQVAVGGNSASPKKFDVHGAYSLSASNPGKIKPLEVEELTKNTNVLQSPSRSSSTSSYGSVGSGGESSLSSYASLSPATKAPSSPHVAQHPKLQSNLQTPNKTELSQNANASPTKKLLWDRGLLNSLINLNDGLQEALEAQGFTPTDSRSKLYYDFKKDQQKNANEESPSKTFSTTRIPSPPASPSKVRSISLAELIRSNSPQKSSQVTKQESSTACLPVTQTSNTCLPLPPPPPVVVSCLPKSPVSSPSRLFARVSSPETKIKGRGRDVSPSKVGEMRSRWEQHIRQASPERTDRSRSPRKTESPKKVPSPKKNQQVTSTSNTEIPSQSASVNHESPSKSPEKYNQSGFKRFTSERKSWREVSPHKPGPIGEVVKGEAPMPQAVPLVDQPFSSSVRERAAAFDSAKKQEPQKDPAEMSVQERLAIFSKKQGGALVPKAPFGQPVPAKALQSGSVGSQEAAIHSSVAHSQPVQRPSKRMASEAASTFEHHGSVSQKNDKHMSPDKKRITNFEQQRKAFEYIEDSWQDNDISSKVRAERQQEMEVLLNRFKKPKQMPKSNNIENRHQSLNEKPRYPVESESEYLESDESIGESSTSEDSSQDNMPGPPKPPRLYKDVIPEAPPLQDAVARRTQLSPLKVHQSPKKEFIPKMKPGCIYPSLSDIESHSEAPDSQDEDVKDSSFAESVLTCTSMESLGQKIQKVANTGSRRPLSMIEESTYSQTRVNSSMSESTMEALDAIDDAIDEALDDDLSPTPPKRQCSRDNMNVYKTPKINDTPPSHNTEEQDVTLAHSISMYRKQKPDVICTPVRQIIRRPDLHSPSPEPVSPSVTVSARIKELQEEVLEQQRVIAQASNAVSVVLKRPEQQGTPQHVEAEKLLLLSSQKRQSALNEIQRIKAEGALGQQSWAGDDTCMGSISISNITVPLKHEFLQRGMKGNDLYHLMVLVKHREQVISSQLMTTPECVVEGAVTFPNLIALHHLTSNFNITLEVYALSTQEPRQLNMKKEQSRMKLTPLKKLHKHESRTASPSIQSPGGPFAVRTSSFQLVGFTHLNMSTLTRNAWTLEMVPYSSSLDGHLLMHVNCSFEGGITERGFLTMFEDVGGYGAWNRRWCVLSGMHLRYWKYPDDETRKEASGKLDLRSCTTRRVELVSRDICARQHTFQLTLLRPAHPGEETNLVQEVKGSSVVTKMLLSADSKEERMVWCNKLNKALANIRAWDPDAMQPQDYQV
ncbi:anillin-like isoform X3 [Portunus trituberculatus]|uniref:anillin-like isoform X3 n=1 Tax=Portunus trituberculatus TaxID=210409 RepID=UPI001E1D0822|nr:anillin-like isoform X3 [Portunus trituberculatus]